MQSEEARLHAQILFTERRLKQPHEDPGDCAREALRDAYIFAAIADTESSDIAQRAAEAISAQATGDIQRSEEQQARYHEARRRFLDACVAGDTSTARDIAERNSHLGSFPIAAQRE